MKGKDNELLIFFLGLGIMFILLKCLYDSFSSVNEYEIIGAPINLASRRPNIVDLHNSLEGPGSGNYYPEYEEPNSENFNSGCGCSQNETEHLTGDLNADIEWGDEYPYHIDEQLFGDEMLTW
jgi:hypothetical protein